MSEMERLGFYPFMNEVNHNPCVVGKKPSVVEYSFIRLFDPIPTMYV